MTSTVFTMQLSTIRPSHCFAPSRRPAQQSRYARSVRSWKVKATAADEDIGTVGLVTAGAGLLLNPIVLWSEYTKLTTGAGLPPGPGGLLGAAEGVGYLVVLGIVGWSVYTKVQTSSGLPAGPSGLLGAAEGFSYLSLLGAIVAFGAAAFQ